MGALRTSEEGGEVVGGEAKTIRSDDDARAIDAPGRIIIESTPAPGMPAQPRPSATMPSVRPQAPQRASGPGLVIFVYVLATAALAAAIYERFLM